MRIVFNHWKYIIKNIWFVLPMAVIPAIFLALSIDFKAIEHFFVFFFSGEKLTFSEVFSAWSVFQFQFELKTVYAIFALVSVVIFLTLTLTFVEKHMRIGKRTLSGVFAQFTSHLLPVLAIVALYFALYECCALVLSAMLFTVSALGAKPIAVVLLFLLLALFLAAFLYLATIFYLWLPCMQITGMSAFSALLYSYRLTMGARGELFLSILVSFAPAYCILLACSFIVIPVAVIVAFLICVALFLCFAVRMETFFFYADKIDREDLLRSYREL